MQRQHISIGIKSKFLRCMLPVGFINMESSLFRSVRHLEIETLERQGNYSTHWANVFIADTFTFTNVRGCTFSPGDSGVIILGRFNAAVSVNGISMASGLLNSNFYGTCIVSDDCLVSGTSLLHNVYIGPGACVLGCGSVTGQPNDAASSPCTFGSLSSIELGAESYGRSFPICVKDTYSDIITRALGSSNSKTATQAPTSTPTRIWPVIDRTSINISIAEEEEEGVEVTSSFLTIIAEAAAVTHCPAISRSRIDAYAVITSATIQNSTIASSRARPSSVVEGARLKNCLLQAGCRVEGPSRLDTVFMFESSSVGEMARIVHSVLGPDSSVAGGECHHSLVGPFVGFHHQSLLISALWPWGRGNVAYAAKVGANHTGRVNDQESWLGEGCFFGLSSSLKYPVNLMDSPYSIVAPETAVSPQSIRLPFSLLLPFPATLTAEQASCIHAEGCLIKPGWVLTGNPYMLERAGMKYGGRKKSQCYNTSYSILRPRLIDQLLDARSRLTTLSPQLASQSHKAFVSPGIAAGFGRTSSSVGDIANAITAYSDLIKRYALHGLFWLILSKKESALLDIQKAYNTSATTASPSDVASSSSSQSQWADRMMASCIADAEVFALPEAGFGVCDCSEGVQAAHRLGAFIADSWLPAVRTHQLTVLVQEFPDVDFIRELSVDEADLKHCGGDDSASATPSLSASPLLLALLRQLARLERDFATRVLDCRARDGERGRAVIPDYDSINPHAVDALRDATVARADRRAAFFESVTMES